jgi:hypothetical protein
MAVATLRYQRSYLLTCTLNINKGVAEWEYELKFFRKINNDPLRLCAFACNKKNPGSYFNYATPK